MIPGADVSQLLPWFIGRHADHPLFAQGREPPWRLTADAPAIIAAYLATLGRDYRLHDEGVAVHVTARIEDGAVIKGPAVIGARAFVAATAYLRGGVFLDEDCIIGPAAELKSAFLFKGSKLAHLNFVGDSILGEGVNCEAGSIIANHRNEWADKRIRIAFAGGIIDTGVDKFGALVGDGARLGANAVIAPGALILPHAVIPRLGLVDQSPERDEPGRE
jgi:NDP-sugar pyrophosphorylase family protein